MVESLMKNLDDCLKKGDYYEVHQIYRTIYYRLLRKKEYVKIYELLLDGSKRLFEANQPNSGADLTLLILDLLVNKDTFRTVVNKRKQTVVIDELCSLFEKMLPNSPERIQFFTMISSSYLPITIVRGNLAKILWKEKNYAEARLHFIYSSDTGENCALMLIEYQNSLGNKYEIDLMIAQFVLQVLCVQNNDLAFKSFILYTGYHPEIKRTEPPFITPLLNFIFFLLVAIDKYRGQSKIFNVLCDLYEKSLNRDSCYKDYLRQIGQIYFDIEKKQTSGGLFSNLMQSLFDFGEHEETTPSSSSPQPRQNTNNTTNNISNPDNQEIDLD